MNKQEALAFLPPLSERKVWDDRIESTYQAMRSKLREIKAHSAWEKVRESEEDDRFDTAFRIVTEENGLAKKLGDLLPALKKFVGKRMQARGYYQDKKECIQAQTTPSPFKNQSFKDFEARFAEANLAAGRTLRGRI